LSLQIEDIKNSLDNFCRNLDRLVDIMLELEDDLFEFQDQITRELTAILDEARILKDNFEFCLEADADQYVYWLDIPRNERSNDVVLHAVPLNIAELLKKLLFDNLDTAVFTSATLAVNKSFDYFESRTGLKLLEDKNITTEILGSPFDFENQLHLGVADFIPDPRSTDFADNLEDTIKKIHENNRTGMLVLFTNYSLLHSLFEKLKPHFDAEHVLLMAQVIKQ